MIQETNTNTNLFLTGIRFNRLGNLQCPLWRSQKENLYHGNKGEREKHGKSYCGGKFHHSDINDCAK